MNKIYGLISIGIFLSYRSMACVCSYINDAKTEYKRSDIVFAVKVIEVLNTNDPFDTITNEDGEVWIAQPVFGYSKKVQVLEVYKGRNIQYEMIKMGDSSNCELYLEVGEEYIIYGWLENGEIRTNSCTRSGRRYVHPYLKYLRRKQKKKTAN